VTARRLLLVDRADLDLLLSFEKRGGAPGAWPAHDRLRAQTMADHDAALPSEAAAARAGALLDALEEELRSVGYDRTSLADIVGAQLDKVRQVVDAHRRLGDLGPASRYRR
jgi:glutathione S-transferase